MRIRVKDTRDRHHGIALCLSGGGFRAALFHLGALRRLHESGILACVETISSVSGGSILAAFLATRLVRRGSPNGLRFSDWDAEVAGPFRAFAARDLRTFPVLAHMLWNWLLPEFRVRHLERRYRARLTNLTLGELPVIPKFILCATDLTFGVNFEFSRERAGDWQAGYSEPGRWLLASAVAASACFPPLFGPMRVRARAVDFRRGEYRKNDREALLKRLRLTDGGVYDNMALEPVWKNHRCILVSDGGAPFEFRTGLTPLRRLLRYTSVSSNQTRALRKRAFFADLGQRRMEGAYWSISSATTGGTAADMLGYPKQLVDDVIAKIRTDLDAFSEAEMDVLENHGYFAAERSVRRRLSHLVTPEAPGPAAPYPMMLDEGVVRAALKNSHKRMSLRRFRLRLPAGFASQVSRLEGAGRSGKPGF